MLAECFAMWNGILKLRIQQWILAEISMNDIVTSPVYKIDGPNKLVCNQYDASR